jgi:hypothetical protein
MTAFLERLLIIVLFPIALAIAIRVLLGIGVGILMAKNCIAPVLFLLIAAMPLRAQEIPLEQYVRDYFRQKALKEKTEQEARKAQPKPTPTPTPLPPVDIFAPYHAPSLLDSIPRRDYKPIYIRPELVPTPTPVPTPQPKSRPTRKPTRKTFYVSQ